MERKKLIIEENKKLRRLQLMVDLTIQLIAQKRDLKLTEGLQYIQNTRTFAIQLFPDKAHVFDLIYRPRLLRVLGERGMLNICRN